jgi:hypothetical protein
MSDLRRELDLLRREVDFPPTPDIAGAVRRRLEAPRRRRTRPQRRLALTLAAALVLLAALMAAVPGARDSVLDLFGLRGATVEVRPELPEREVSGLQLGDRVPLADARSRASFSVLVPGALGAPEAVYLSRRIPGGEVTLVYRRGGLLISQFRGDLDPDYVGKIVSQASGLERSDGRIWIEGAPHFFFYRAPDGGLREHTLRLAGNVLLLERGRLLVRIEGAPTQRRALEIAQTLR